MVVMQQYVKVMFLLNNVIRACVVGIAFRGLPVSKYFSLLTCALTLASVTLDSLSHYSV